MLTNPGSRHALRGAGMAATAASVEQPLAAQQPEASAIAAAQAFDHTHTSLRRSASADGRLVSGPASNSNSMLEGYTVWRPHRQRTPRRRSRTGADSHADLGEAASAASSGGSGTSFDWAHDGSPRFHDADPLLPEPFSSDPAWWDIEAHSPRRRSERASTSPPRRWQPMCPLDSIFRGSDDDAAALAEEGGLAAEGVPADGPDLADFASGMEGDIMKAAATAAATVDGGDAAEVSYLEQLRQRVLALNTVCPHACSNPSTEFHPA